MSVSALEHSYLPCTWLTFFRQAPVNQSKGKAHVNGFLPTNHQQIAVSGRQDNSGSTDETSASSGVCQCRCTCGGQHHIYFTVIF